MAEKLNAFIALYNKKAEERLAKKSSELEQFKKLRSEAIAFKDSVSLQVDDIKYSTLGEFVAALYPETGGVDNFLFTKLYPIVISNFDKDSDEDKNKRKVIDGILKVKNAPTQYKRALAVKEQGGEKFFGGVRSAAISIVTTAQSRGTEYKFDTLLGTNSKDPKEKIIKNFYEVLTQSPYGDVYEFLDKYGILHDIDIFSSEELYDAMVEAGPPPEAEKKEAASPINQESSEKKSEPVSTGQINNAESTAKPETGTQSPAITASETTTAPPEPESAVVTTPAAINQPVETPTAETTPVKTEPVSQVNQPEITVGEKEVAQIQTEKARQEKVSSAITETVSKLNVSEEKKTEVSKILEQFAAKQKGSAEAPPATALERELQKFGELRQNFQNISSPITTAVSSTGNTVNAPSTTKIATTELTSAVEGNTSTVAESTTINNTSTATTSSSPLQLNETQQSIVNQFKQKFGIMTPEERKKQEEVQKNLEQSIRVEGGQSMLKTTKEPESTVERGSVQFNERIPAANVQTTSIANNQNIQNVPQEVKVAEVTSTPQPVTGGAGMTAPPSEAIAAGGQQSTSIDLSEVSKRLRNLEELLSAPLTVKIA